VRSERYVSRHDFCRRMHGRLLYISGTRLPINRAAPERRHTLSVMMQSVLPSGDAPAVIRNRYALRGSLRRSVESPISKQGGSAKFVSPEDESEIAQTSSLKLDKHDGSVFWLGSDSGVGRSQRKIIVKRFGVKHIIGADKMLVFWC
jgi:hypothetical protein